VTGGAAIVRWLTGTGAAEGPVSATVAEAPNSPFWLEQLPPTAAQRIYQTFYAKNKVQ
jgi:hypothetical protein